MSEIDLKPVAWRYEFTEIMTGATTIRFSDTEPTGSRPRVGEVTPLYSAATIERLTREKTGAEEAYFKAWHERDAQRRRAEAAEAELAKARQERDEKDALWRAAIEQADSCVGEWEREKTRAESLSAQLAKAREALEQIAETDIIYPPHDPGNYFAPEGREGPCAKIARAALAPAKPEGDAQ